MRHRVILNRRGESFQFYRAGISNASAMSGRLSQGGHVNHWHPFLAPGEQVGEPSPLLGRQARNEAGEGVSVRLILVFSATSSATSGIARRKFKLVPTYNGATFDSEARGCRFKSRRAY